MALVGLVCGCWSWYRLGGYSGDLAEGIVDGLRTGNADVPWVFEGNGPGLPKAIVTNIIMGHKGSNAFVVKGQYDLTPSMCKLVDSLIKERMSRKLQPAPSPTAAPGQSTS
jgi:hypothetical protein